MRLAQLHLTLKQIHSELLDAQEAPCSAGSRSMAFFL